MALKIIIHFFFIMVVFGCYGTVCSAQSFYNPAEMGEFGSQSQQRSTKYRVSFPEMQSGDWYPPDFPDRLQPAEPRGQQKFPSQPFYDPGQQALPAFAEEPNPVSYNLVPRYSDIPENQNQEYGTINQPIPRYPLEFRSYMSQPSSSNQYGQPGSLDQLSFRTKLSLPQYGRISPETGMFGPPLSDGYFYRKLPDQRALYRHFDMADEPDQFSSRRQNVYKLQPDNRFSYDTLRQPYIEEPFLFGPPGQPSFPPELNQFQQQKFPSYHIEEPASIGQPTQLNYREYSGPYYLPRPYKLPGENGQSSYGESGLIDEQRNIGSSEFNREGNIPIRPEQPIAHQIHFQPNVQRRSALSDEIYPSLSRENNDSEDQFRKAIHSQKLTSLKQPTQPRFLPQSRQSSQQSKVNNSLRDSDATNDYIQPAKFSPQRPNPHNYIDRFDYANQDRLLERQRPSLNSRVSDELGFVRQPLSEPHGESAVLDKQSGESGVISQPQSGLNSQQYPYESDMSKQHERQGLFENEAVQEKQFQSSFREQAGRAMELKNLPDLRQSEQSNKSGLLGGRAETGQSSSSEFSGQREQSEHPNFHGKP